jgi:hypothetical protein
MATEIFKNDGVPQEIHTGEKFQFANEIYGKVMKLFARFEIDTQEAEIPTGVLVDEITLEKGKTIPVIVIGSAEKIKNGVLFVDEFDPDDKYIMDNNSDFGIIQVANVSNVFSLDGEAHRDPRELAVFYKRGRSYGMNTYTDGKVLVVTGEGEIWKPKIDMFNRYWAEPQTLVYFTPGLRGLSEGDTSRGIDGVVFVNPPENAVASN